MLITDVYTLSDDKERDPLEVEVEERNKTVTLTGTDGSAQEILATETEVQPSASESDAPNTDNKDDIPDLTVCPCSSYQSSLPIISSPTRSSKRPRTRATTTPVVAVDLECLTTTPSTSDSKNKRNKKLVSSPKKSVKLKFEDPQNESCVVCGVSLKKLEQRKVSEKQKQIRANGLCKLIRISVVHFLDFFMSNKFCSNCHLNISQAGEEFDALETIQCEILRRKVEVEALMKDNFRRITRSARAKKAEKLKKLEDQNHFGKCSSYIEMLQRICEEINIPEPYGDDEPYAFCNIGTSDKVKDTNVNEKTIPPVEVPSEIAKPARLGRPNSRRSYVEDDSFQDSVDAVGTDQTVLDDIFDCSSPKRKRRKFTTLNLELDEFITDEETQQEDEGTSIETDDSEYIVPNSPNSDRSSVYSQHSNGNLSMSDDDIFNETTTDIFSDPEPLSEVNHDKKPRTKPKKIKGNVKPKKPRTRIKTTKPTPFKCRTEDCKQEFTSEGRRDQHDLTVHGGVKPVVLNCDDCEKCFKNRVMLRRHWRKEHNPATSKQSPSHQCSNCSMTFPNEEELAGHILLHNQESSHFTCVVCKTVFSNSVDLKTHMKKVHSEKVAPEMLGKFKCKHEWCDGNFKSRVGLRQHMQRHDGNLPFKCSFGECTAAFVGPHQLEEHSKTHSDEKQFICDICGEKLKYKKGLARHRQKHILIKETGKYRFQCKVCPKTFYENYALKRHEETHSTITPYICETCGKSFGVYHNYFLHSKIHQADKKKRIRPSTKRSRKKPITEEPLDTEEEFVLLLPPENSGKSLRKIPALIPTRNKVLDNAITILVSEQDSQEWIEVSEAETTQTLSWRSY